MDSLILSRGLQGIGYTEKAVKELIGNYKTCATPISNIVLALVAPITASIIPLISSTIASGNKDRVKKIMYSTLRVTVIVILPCVLGISALAKPIITMLFNDASAADNAGPLLSILAISVFFMSMIQVSAAFLQAHKLVRKPIISVAAGALTKLVVTYALVSIPVLNIKGSPISSIISSFVISAMNFYFIGKYIGFTPNFIAITVRPLVSALGCAGAAFVTHKLLLSTLGNTVALFVGIFVGAFVYALLIFLMRAVGREEIELLPKGRKIAALLSRMKLIK